MNEDFKHLIDYCGLSKKGAAKLLNVRYDTIKNWYYGRAQVPDGILSNMREYAKCASKIFANQSHSSK